MGGSWLKFEFQFWECKGQICTCGVLGWWNSNVYAYNKFLLCK